MTYFFCLFSVNLCIVYHPDIIMLQSPLSYMKVRDEVDRALSFREVSRFFQRTRERERGKKKKEKTDPLRRHSNRAFGAQRLFTIVLVITYYIIALPSEADTVASATSKRRLSRRPCKT